MKYVLARALALLTTPVRADQIDYFCLFSNQAAAQADPVVGAYYNTTAGSWDTSQTFPGVSVITPQAIINGMATGLGFWIIVSKPAPNAALAGNTTHCVMVLDRDIANANGSFVLSSQIAGANRTALTFSPLPMGGNYPLPLGQ